jgi:lipopolysaccharide/colanic/teichoic acid biosynthesis glycosyltransferase
LVRFLPGFDNKPVLAKPDSICDFFRVDLPVTEAPIILRLILRLESEAPLEVPPAVFGQRWVGYWLVVFSPSECRKVEPSIYHVIDHWRSPGWCFRGYRRGSGIGGIKSAAFPGSQRKGQATASGVFGGDFPEPLFIKYYFDISLAFLVLIVSAPIWMVIAFFIWWEDPGPIFFIKNSVGRCGINFLQIKFRSMIWNAENETGPVLAAKDDKRLLFIGKFLRKMALDELPQVINILRGEMSFVGPRPQRTFLVNNYIKDLPQYALRHRVRPGLAGLAQVVGHYYVTPLQKLRYDRIYVRHISLRFDLKILLWAFLIVFWFRWQKDWNGCLPAWLLEF